MRKNKITLAYLWWNVACPQQRSLFWNTFGWSAKITPENVDKARAAGLDLSWFNRRYAANLAEYVSTQRDVLMDRKVSESWSEIESETAKRLIALRN